MAVIREQFCIHCREDTMHCNYNCVECGEARAAEKQKAEDLEWNSKSVEEKLDWLREQVIDISKIERNDGMF